MMGKGGDMELKAGDSISLIGLVATEEATGLGVFLSCLRTIV